MSDSQLLFKDAIMNYEKEVCSQHEGCDILISAPLLSDEGEDGSGFPIFPIFPTESDPLSVATVTPGPEAFTSTVKEGSEVKTGEVVTYQPQPLWPVTQAPLSPPPDVIVKATDRPGVGAEIPHVSHSGAVGSGGSVVPCSQHNTTLHKKLKMEA